MGAPACTEQEFLQLWELHHGHVQSIANALGLSERVVYTRGKRLSKKYGELKTNGGKLRLPDNSKNISLSGTAVIFSDAHWWPNVSTPATEIMIKIIEHIQPEYVIANGDIVDGYQLSRFDRIGWDVGPSPAEELEITKQWLGEIESASKAKCLRTIGNHDIRFDTYLSSNAPLVSDIKGCSLSDHITWPDYWSINVDDETIIKHRWKGGKHAAYNNAVGAGVSIVTGHTHRLAVRAVTDYKGTRFGIETGTLCNPQGPQMGYCEHNALDMQEGCIVMHDSKHFEPVHVDNGQAKWGGKVWK